MGKIPEGFYVDESAFGYNAYSILKTGRDEWGKRFPVYFESFGEFKLPVYPYLTIIPIFLFGLNEFSIRFLSAICGIITILFTYLLGKSLTKNIFINKQNNYIGIIAAFFLTFDLWHLHFSRIALEANVALLFVVVGFYLLFKSKKFFDKKSLISYVFLIFSFFTYLASRLFVPLLTIFLIFFTKDKKEKNKWFVILLIFCLLFLLTLLNPASFNRIKGISIFHPIVKSEIEANVIEKINEHQKFPLIWKIIHNKPIEYTLKIINQYLNHFSPQFLFFKGEEFDQRFSIPFSGPLLLFELPFFLVGLYLLFKIKQWPLCLWFFLAPLPSAFSFRSPSLLRSIFMLPVFQIIAAVGVVWLFQKKLLLKPALIIFTSLLLMMNIAYSLDNYFVHQLLYKPYHWNYGFKQVALKVKSIENNYDKIIVGKEGTPYIHFLFFQQRDPQTIWSEIERLPQDNFGFRPVTRIGKYYFYQNCPTPKPSENVLYICGQEPASNNITIIDKIYYRDGVLDMVIFESKLTN